MPSTKFAHALPLPKEQLPTMYDLPSEDPKEPGLPDEFHYYQPQLLRETFCPPAYDPDRYFVAMDLNLYYDVQHTSRYKRPDWFAVLDHTRRYENRDMRLSYVIWQEQVSPYLVVELLSPGTEKEDLGEVRHDPEGIPGKWEVYERYLQVPYYVVFSRYTDELHYFVLEDGRYREHFPPDGRLWLAEAQMGLGLWTGRIGPFAERQWLRCFAADGVWIPTLKEREHLAQQQLEQERLRADEVQQQAERLAAKLRALGIDPE